MKQRAKITDAMRSAGGGTRATVPAQPQEQAQAPAPSETQAKPAQPAQSSRAGTRAITAHFPPEVRQQLKLLAVEQGRTNEDMIAEALNDLFAKYGKAEIAPLKGPR